MNHKHEEGGRQCERAVTVAQSSGLKAATDTPHTRVCVCVCVHACVCDEQAVCVRAYAGRHVKLCNELQLFTFMAVCGPWCPYSLNF